METVHTLADGELPKLKSLANDLLATETPGLAMLDEIASIALGIAARWRDETRRELLGQVARGAQTVFATAIDDLETRLSHASLDELTGLAALLDEATTARMAFSGADAALMAARDRGDYAAMAPLALVADTQKNALTASGAEVAKRLGLDDPLKPDLGAAITPAPAATETEPAMAEGVGDAAVSDRELAAAPELTVEFAVAEPLGVDLPAAPPLPEDRAAARFAFSAPGEPQPERRRLRALIRQMRPPVDDVP